MCKGGTEMNGKKYSIQRTLHSSKSKNRYPGIGIILFFLFSLGIISFSRQQEPIKHEVSVTGIIIPLFAFDSKGNPVYDLQKEDLKLYINGKKVEINSLNPIKFQYEQETIKKIKEEKVKEADVTEKAAVVRERVIFLVIDTMYNSFYGLKNAKKIAKNLIAGDSFGGEFVVMQNSLFGGLKLMGGPDTDRKRLKKYIRKISALPDRNPAVAQLDVTVRSSPNPNADLNLLSKREERKHAKEKIKFFVDFLSQLKYSLQAIEKAKIVILVSEGLPEVLFFENNPYLRKNVSYDPTPILNIKRLVKEITEGGSLLYAVYPGRNKLYKEKFNFAPLGKGEVDMGDFEETLDSIDLPISRRSGIESLKAISVGSGGRVFDGSSERIVKEIQKTTSAYYELAFSPGADSDENMRIKIKCRRKGVKINYLARAAKSKTYIGMDKIQKKVFALNLVMGRKWASMMAKMEKVDFKWQNQGSEKKAIEVNIPGMIKGRAVDIFLIRFEEGFKNPGISLKNKKVSDTEIIEIKEKQANQSLYFLMIEPQSVICLYNMIK
jgi:VWFA-related protein